MGTRKVIAGQSPVGTTSGTTREEYEAAQVRINAVMNAGPGTPEASELWVLTILILQYEAENQLEPTRLIDAAGGYALPLKPALETARSIADTWHLTTTEACALTSLPALTLTDTSLPFVSAETRLRIELLWDILVHLTILFSVPLSRDWPTLPNTEKLFGGRRPIDVMIDGGLPTMDIVRRDIIALRGTDSIDIHQSSSDPVTSPRTIPAHATKPAAKLS